MKTAIKLDPIPHGHCACGCGHKLPIRTRFIHGHYSRCRTARYRIDSKGCWVFLGHITKNGYPGCIMWKGRKDSAHRAYYRRFKGEIPAGMQIDHLCRNRACVNPDHLEAVDNKTNNRRRPNLKLNLADANKIRELVKDGVAKKTIVSRYGVSRAAIKKIVDGVMWV